MSSESVSRWYADDASLELNLHAVVGYDCVIRIGSWADGLSASREAEGDKSTIDAGTVGDWLLSSKDKAIANWRHELPSDILAMVQQLPDHRLAVLSLVANSAVAMDLLESNPLLLWLWVDRRCADCDERAHRNELVDELKTKQPALLARLAPLGTKQHCKLLKKAAGVQLTRGDVERLLRVLENSEACRYLSHSAQVRARELLVLDEFDWLPATRARLLIPHLVERQATRWLRDTLQMLPQDDHHRVANCDSMAALIRLHDRLVTALNAGNKHRLMVLDEAGNAIPLPDPPIAGNRRIRYLATQEDIVDEGRKMHHCVASYLRRCIDGKYFLYQMAEPRLTIGVRVEGGNPQLAEVRGVCNALPEETDMAYISDWFIGNA